MNTVHTSIRATRGYSLIELMIVVAIIGVIASVAVPAYNGYIETATTGTAQANADSLAGFEDTYFYENESYLAGTYNPPGANGLAALSWVPSGDKDLYSYKVEAGTTGDIATSYLITVTSKANTGISATVSKP